jgi:hypothetical protein
MATHKTQHAKARKRHRNAPTDAIEIVLTWGRWIHQRAGRIAYFLGRIEIELASRNGVDLSRYDGLAVIEAHDEAILTLIRAGSPHRLKRSAS